MSGKPRPVDGADLAEGMTFESGGRAYTIKGIADALEGGRRRNAYVCDSAGTPGAFAVCRGTRYPVLDGASGRREAEAGQ